MRSFYEAFMLEMKFIFRLATTTFCTGHNNVLRELWQVVSQWTLFNYDFHVRGKSKFLEENYQRIPVNVANTMKRTHTIGKCRECRTIPALIHQIHQSYHHHKNVSLQYRVCWKFWTVETWIFRNFLVMKHWIQWTKR